jgi:hypothetical protein
VRVRAQIDVEGMRVMTTDKKVAGAEQKLRSLRRSVLSHAASPPPSLVPVSSQRYLAETVLRSGVAHDGCCRVETNSEWAESEAAGPD